MPRKNLHPSLRLKGRSVPEAGVKEARTALQPPPHKLNPQRSALQAAPVCGNPKVLGCPAPIQTAACRPSRPPFPGGHGRWPAFCGSDSGRLPPGPGEGKVEKQIGVHRAGPGVSDSDSEVRGQSRDQPETLQAVGRAGEGKGPGKGKKVYAVGARGLVGGRHPGPASPAHPGPVPTSAAPRGTPGLEPPGRSCVP